MAALRGQEQGHHQAEAEEQHRVLVHQAEAGDQADPQPQPGLVLLEDPHQQKEADGPEQHLEGRDAEHVGGAEVDRRDQHREAGHHLDEAAAAEAAGQEADQQHRRRSRQGGEDPQADERLAEELVRQPRDPGDERGMVDVAEGEVMTAGQEVKLVVVVAVAAEERQMDQQLEGGEDAEESPVGAIQGGWCRGGFHPGSSQGTNEARAKKVNGTSVRQSRRTASTSQSTGGLLKA